MARCRSSWAELEPRLPAGVIDHLPADLAAFVGRRSEASTAPAALEAATRTPLRVPVVIACAVALIGAATPFACGGDDAPICECSGALGCCEVDHSLTCTDVTTDDRNCGTCGVMCPTGTHCVMGECRTNPCPTGLQPCTRGGCVDLEANPAHCGNCDNACAPMTGCVGGACQPAPDE